MRNFPKDDWDLEELKNLEASNWMVEVLKVNPAYNSWGPGEDGMSSGRQSFVYESWKEFDLELDDLNEVVNFHFEVTRPEEECLACEGSGFNEATRKIEKAFSPLDGRKGWEEELTGEDVSVLAKAGYLRKNQKGGYPSVDELNQAQRLPFSNPELFIDSGRKFALVEGRAKRLGVFGKCDNCGGKGNLFTGDCQLSLVLWVLHPRKGESLGITVSRITEEDLPLAFQFLHNADVRNAGRFSRVTEQWRIQNGRSYGGLGK